MIAISITKKVKFEFENKYLAPPQLKFLLSSGGRFIKLPFTVIISSFDAILKRLKRYQTMSILVEVATYLFYLIYLIYPTENSGNLTP